MHLQIPFPKRSVSGFTTIEVVIVLIIISILSVAVINRVQDTSIDLIGETELIKTHIRYAQARAMNTSSVWGVNLAGSTYSLFKNGSIANKVPFPGEESDTRTLPAGTTVETAIISFDDWGVPHTDAAASDGQELTSGDAEAKITVTSGGDTKTITITQNTGFIP